MDVTVSKFSFFFLNEALSRRPDEFNGFIWLFLAYGLIANLRL
jgi:hypothetical protein